MRSNVPIVLSRRSAYRVCGVTGLDIDIVLEVDAFVCSDCSSIYGPKMLSRIGSCAPVVSHRTKHAQDALADDPDQRPDTIHRSEEHTFELQSHSFISYAV